MSRSPRPYRGRTLTVLYDARRCIHAAECVRGLPEVFDPGRRPWIDADAADPEKVAAVVERCPTGALSLDEPPIAPHAGPPQVTVAADGPLYLRGTIELVDDEGSVTWRERRAALCRCGASENKPFCDGAHAKAGFRDAGKVEVRRPAEVTGSTLVVSFASNGPAIVRGPFLLRTDSGQEVGCSERAAFCRCGASEDRPYCDGSHSRIGFRG